MRKKAVSLILVVFLITIGVAGYGSIVARGEDATDGTDTGMNWLTDYEEALNQAQAENKPILINFYTDWCSACRRLDQYTYTDKELYTFLNANFINLRDYAGNTPLYVIYGVRYVPTIIFNTQEGYDGNNTISRYQGFMSSDVFLERAQAALEGMPLPADEHSDSFNIWLGLGPIIGIVIVGVAFNRFRQRNPAGGSGGNKQRSGAAVRKKKKS